MLPFKRFGVTLQFSPIYTNSGRGPQLGTVNDTGKHDTEVTALRRAAKLSNHRTYETRCPRSLVYLLHDDC